MKAILVKDKTALDACRCGSYCGETSPAIADLIYGETAEEVLRIAVERLPNHDGSTYADDQARLYVIEDDLSEELLELFAARIEREREEEAAAKVRVATARAAADREAALARLRLRISAIEGGEELAGLQRELAELEAGGTA